MISLLEYVATFSGQIYFCRSYFFTLFQSNYFDTTVTFSGQLFLQNSCCFLLFQSSRFFAGVIFLEKLLPQRENSTEQPLLENRKFFTAVTFRDSYFFRRNCLGLSYIKSASFSKQVLLHNINLFRKVTFWKKLIFQNINFRITYFSWRPEFRATSFWKDATFYSSYLFRKATFLQHSFSEELLFHSYVSFWQLHFLFLRYYLCKLSTI